MLVATVEALLLLYLVNAIEEVFGLRVLFDVLTLDLQLLLAIELALEAGYLALLTDVGDTPRFSTLFVHLSIWNWDTEPPLLPYGEFFLRPREDVESSKGCADGVGPLRMGVCCLAGEREYGLGGVGLNPRTRFVTLLAVLDICLPSTAMGSSTAGLGTVMVGLRSPLLLPIMSFHFDGFLVTVGVGGTASVGIGGTGGTVSIM
jgi:hypothetical protein